MTFWIAFGLLGVCFGVALGLIGDQAKKQIAKARAEGAATAKKELLDQLWESAVNARATGTAVNFVRQGHRMNLWPLTDEEEISGEIHRRSQPLVIQ